MQYYSVKKLAKLAGISVRTLHYYDRIGLLKPTFQNEANYRFYGEKEFLRLQQILFYRTMGVSLKSIITILDDPDFDVLQALERHQAALLAKQQQVADCLMTIKKTILNLRSGMMLKPEELYKGLSIEKALVYRPEALEKWGKDAIEKSENTLWKMEKTAAKQLIAAFGEHWQELADMCRENPVSPHVQTAIEKHYRLIRQLWGTADSSDLQAECYIGLGKLYMNDQRYTLINGQPHPEFAAFMYTAMTHFAETALK